MSPGGVMTSTTVPVNAASEASSASSSVNVAQLHAATRSEVPRTNAPTETVVAVRNIKTHEIVPARCRITPSWTTEQDVWFLGLLARSELPLGATSRSIVHRYGRVISWRGTWADLLRSCRLTGREYVRRYRART